MYDTTARKRPVNLTVNEDLLSQARDLTDNLSRVVEALLADFVAREQLSRAARARECAAVSATWNRFNDAHGSFADDYSPL
jgi:antitoxin CcdA